MPKRLVLAAVLTVLPTLTLAQGAAPNAAVCDGSDIRRAGQLRTVGYSLFGATVLADLASVLTIPRTPEGAKEAGGHFKVIGMTAPVALAGLFIAGRASPGDRFWKNVVAHLKVGKTKSAEVQSCLQRPQVRTSMGSEESWTYLLSRPSILGPHGYHSLRLTFHDGVLAEVLTKEVERPMFSATRGDTAGLPLDRHRGFCVPPVPTVADPFPTPTDTTDAAKATARAQADADAAMKNAAAAAAYAACLSSDSAR